MTEVKVSNMDLTPENGISPEEKRFSKVNGKMCRLKMKVFSNDGKVNEVEYSSEEEISPVISVDLEDQKMFNEINNSPEQKSYSVASVKERLRMAKFSPRARFKRLMIDYKKFYEMVKNNISHDDFVLLKGLFTSDVMNIMNLITPEIRKGKQINTLLGLSALGKELRVAGQKLQIPYRMAINEEVRTGAVSKKRWQDISNSYNEFIDALLKYVFGEDYKNIGVDEMANVAESATSEVQPTSIKG